MWPSAAVKNGAVSGGAVAYVFIVRGRKRRNMLFGAWLKKLMRIESVATPNASPAGGHYSQAIKHGEQVYVSGLLPITPDGTKMTTSPFDKQASIVLDNLEAILTAAGSSLQKLIQVRVYITDIDNWGEFNALYAAQLGSHKPARCVVPVPVLHYGALLEVEAIAAC